MGSWNPVSRLRNEMSDRPESANGLIKALRQVFKSAFDVDLIDNNPAAEVEMLASNNPKGFRAWSI